jgi:hypothetical protein
MSVAFGMDPGHKKVSVGSTLPLAPCELNATGMTWAEAKCALAKSASKQAIKERIFPTLQHEFPW